MAGKQTIKPGFHIMSVWFDSYFVIEHKCDLGYSQVCNRRD
jgi:hypothetical protein